jgi:hypothetical protein
MIQEFQYFVELELIHGMSLQMLPVRCKSTIDRIQMKVMNVIRTMKNMIIYEFQRSVEFQLILADENENAVDSIANLIQMKLMKVVYNMKNMMIREFQHQHKS